MRIQKIDKLNHARFKNFSWSANLDAFSNFVNILFGWNGSGKTTFSKVFRYIERGKLDTGCRFKITTDSIPLIDSTDFSVLKDKIRVFNDDYIADTLSVNPNIPYIFFAGEEAVDYATDEKKLDDKKAKLHKFILPDIHDTIAKNAAYLIKNITGINSFKKELTGVSTYASYDKTDFEKRITYIRERIQRGELQSAADLIRSDIEALKTQLVNTDQSARIDNNISEAAQWLLDNINQINVTLESTPIQKKSNRIASLGERELGWIEKGVEIHFSPDHHLKNCLFCNSELANKEELIKHFSEEVVRSINAVDGYLRKIDNFTKGFPKNDSPSPSQKLNINVLRTIFDDLSLKLLEKRNAISNKKDSYKLDTEKINEFTIVTPLDTNNTVYNIESHYVAEQYEAYNEAYIEYQEALKEKKEIGKEISDLTEKVRELKQKAQSTHEHASALNNRFKVVFPYRKIEIIDGNDNTGYELRRDGEQCSFTSLSEGERNFIALAYFISALNDAQNPLADDGIVIIDDPVSSLDKQAIFQIFSMIVNEIKNHSGRQYFILTHNLDFLGHLKRNFEQKIKKNTVRLFCLAVTNGGCVIEKIHPLLQDHRSDYYYVFSILYNHKDVCDMEDAYLIVNLLRRWLETFLEFKFSTSGDLLSTLQTAYAEASSITKKKGTPFNADHLEMHRFINHGSHGFPDTESTDEALLTNAHQRIKDAFLLVNTLDPLHFKKLKSIAEKP